MDADLCGDKAAAGRTAASSQCAAFLLEIDEGHEIICNSLRFDQRLLETVISNVFNWTADDAATLHVLQEGLLESSDCWRKIADKMSAAPLQLPCAEGFGAGAKPHHRHFRCRGI